MYMYIYIKQVKCQLKLKRLSINMYNFHCSLVMSSSPWTYTSFWCKTSQSTFQLSWWSQAEGTDQKESDHKCEQSNWVSPLRSLKRPLFREEIKADAPPHWDEPDDEPWAWDLDLFQLARELGLSACLLLLQPKPRWACGLLKNNDLELCSVKLPLSTWDIFSFLSILLYVF